MAYTDPEGIRRTIFFSIKDEKEEFLREANSCILRLRREEGLAEDDDEYDDER